MVMNAFDTNFDGENEVYAANTIAHCYAKTPIRVMKSRPVRIYLVNIIRVRSGQFIPPAWQFL